MLLTESERLERPVGEYVFREMEERSAGELEKRMVPTSTIGSGLHFKCRLQPN